MVKKKKSFTVMMSNNTPNSISTYQGNREQNRSKVRIKRVIDIMKRANKDCKKQLLIDAKNYP